jgi:hypothetical protein
MPFPPSVIISFYTGIATRCSTSLVRCIINIVCSVHAPVCPPNVIKVKIMSCFMAYCFPTIKIIKRSPKEGQSLQLLLIRPPSSGRYCIKDYLRTHIHTLKYLSPSISAHLHCVLRLHPIRRMNSEVMTFNTWYFHHPLFVGPKNFIPDLPKIDLK